MADVLDRPIRQVEHPIRANARGAARSPASRSGRRRSTTSRAVSNVVETFYARPLDPAAYDELYREFRAIHKQTKGIYASCTTQLRRHADDDVPMRGWGLPSPGELDRVVIVSPHLDDAVLGCAQLHGAHPGRDGGHGVRREPARVSDRPDAQVGRAVGLRAR